MTLERHASLFLESSQAESALDNIVRRINLLNTTSELAARQGLLNLTDQLRSGFTRGALGLQNLTEEEKALLPVAGQNIVKLLDQVSAMEKAAIQGNVSAQALQSFNTRLALIGPIGANAEASIAQLSEGLQALQKNFTQANVEAKQVSSEMSGMPQHAAGTLRMLTQLSSGAQGVMLGMSLARGQIMGAAFSLIFLRFAIIPTVLALGTLTTAVIVANRVIRFMLGSANAAGKVMETFGQQMTNFFQSLSEGRRLTQLASDIARTFGVPIDKARELVFELGKVNQATMSVSQVIANVAAATGEDISQVGQRFVETITSEADQREQVMKQFAKDFDIEVKNYATSIDLLNALQARFAGSAIQSANTQAGQVARLSAMWTQFKETVGEISALILTPFIQLAQMFVTGLEKGFTAARDAAQSTGDLAKQSEEFRSTMNRLMPVVLNLGVLLGRVLFNALTGIMHVMKIVIDLWGRFWQATKPLRDALQAIGKFLKEHVLDGFISAIKHIDEFNTKIEEITGIDKKIVVSVELVVAGLGAITAAGFASKLGSLLTGAVLGAVGKGLKVPILIAWNAGAGAVALLGDAIMDALLATPFVELSPAGAATPIALTTAGWIAIGVLLVVAGGFLLYKLGWLDDVARKVKEWGSIALELAIKFLIGRKGYEALSGALGWIGDRLGEFIPWLVVQMKMLWEGAHFDDVAKFVGDISAKILSSGAVQMIFSSFLWFGDQAWHRTKDFLRNIQQDILDWGYIPLPFAVIFEAVGAIGNTFSDILSWIKGLIGSLDLSIVIKILPDFSFGGLGDPRGWFSDILGGVTGHQFGGKVPGVRGTRHVVIAEAGEEFKGSPAFADARPHAADGSGYGNVSLSIDLRGAVISNRQALDDLAATLGDRISQRLGLSRGISRHRVGG